MKSNILKVLIIGFTILIGIISPASAAVYFVDGSGGNDSNAGTSTDEPWSSLSNVNNRTFAPGDSILLKRGERWEEKLNLNTSGTENHPITIGVYGSGDLPVLRSIAVYGDFIVVEDLIVDGNKENMDAVRITGGRNCVLRRLTVRNGTRDGIDANEADNLLIDSCHIHHFLAGSFTNQVDAHGIVVTRTQGVTIRNTEIHHVSGDSFQTDPARDPWNLTNDIVVENCHFWTGPLAEDFNAGWLKTDHLPDGDKQYPGENAIDTKVLASGWESFPRMRITLRNILAHGWIKDGYISNKAAFNMKEKIEAVFDGVTVYDAEIGFRIRGTRGNADVTIKNMVIYDCEKTIRAEDDLSNLNIYNSTFGDGLGTQVQFAGGSGGLSSWTFLNNGFVEEKPYFADDQSNVVIAISERIANYIDPDSRNYHLISTSKLIRSGKELTDVTVDRDGLIRTAPYDIGAYELSTSDLPEPP